MVCAERSAPTHLTEPFFIQADRHRPRTAVTPAHYSVKIAAMLVLLTRLQVQEYYRRGSKMTRLMLRACDALHQVAGFLLAKLDRHRRCLTYKIAYYRDNRFSTQASYGDQTKRPSATASFNGRRLLRTSPYLIEIRRAAGKSSSSRSSTQALAVAAELRQNTVKTICSKQQSRAKFIDCNRVKGRRETPLSSRATFGSRRHSRRATTRRCMPVRCKILNSTKDYPRISKSGIIHGLAARSGCGVGGRQAHGEPLPHLNNLNW